MTAHPERAAQQLALDWHEVNRAEYLRLIRAEMHRLYILRTTGRGRYVTADDARRYFESLDPPVSLSRKFLGAVFQERGWVQTGAFVRSQTKGSHANLLPCWRWDR